MPGTDATTTPAELPALGEVITTSVTVYTPDELHTLDEREGLPPSRREKALDNLAGKLAEWWDQHEIDQVGETMVYILAEHLRTPGWDTFGEGDFPGVDGVTLQGWDIERGAYAAFDGTLTRENAPALPWVEGIESVTLDGKRSHTGFWLVMDEDTERGETPALVIAEEAMLGAVSEAVHAAWKAGRDQGEYLTSPEYAAEYAQNNEVRFLEDGTYYG